jgi:ribosomal protein L36
MKWLREVGCPWKILNDDDSIISRSGLLSIICNERRDRFPGRVSIINGYVIAYDEIEFEIDL